MPPVHGDRVQLQQVLLNLLLNAMDALDDNPPERRLVTVRARPVGATVEVAVSDNGHGIAADKLSHVFEPFFSSKPNGLGMGLAISRDIIEAHGGRLWAKNNEAGGATFTFTLPAAEGGDAEVNAPVPLVRIVDDDASFLTAVARMLRASGFAVKTFASAAEFLARPELDVPGCVLVDLQMPGLSGLDLQEALAKEGHTLPVIFLSGHGDIPTTVQAMRRGAEDFLTKRAPKEDLLDAVKRAIDRDARERTGRARLEALRARFAALTPREREVLQHVVQGKLNKQIAYDLGIHERTVKLHRTSITTKLACTRPPS